MKSIRSILYIVVIIAGLLLLKYLFFPAVQDEKAGMPSKDASKSGPPTMPASMVSVYVVFSDTLDNNLFATGTIIANESVDLKPEISGKVMKIYFNEGEPVLKGKLLVKLNDADLQAQLKKTNAEIKLAEEKIARYTELLSIKGVAREEYDVATNLLQSLKADAEVLKVQISRTNILAPFDGILGLRNVSEGAFISPLFVVSNIQQLNPVKIDFSIPERYAGIIKKNGIIKFTTEGSSNTHQGVVYAFEPGIDVATRALKIRARAANPGNKLLPGSFAKIELVLNKNENAIMVPTQAIVPILKGQQVFISRNNKAEAINVETGLRNEKMVQIISGLSIGDSVIVTGVMGLRQGMDLKVIK